MAKASHKVLLGFVDEPMTENCSDEQSFFTNKIGGLPDTPDQNSLPKCLLCDRQAPLVVQVYAPSTNSVYHRTLYVHACVNPGCWNKSKSWICMRRQWIASDQSDDKQQSSASFIEWCDDAEDWGDDPGIAEENGNVTSENQAMETNTFMSAEFDSSDADDNVVVEPIESPITDVLQLLDSKKEVPFDHHDIIYFEPYYISVSYEESSDVIKEHAVKLLNNYQNNQIILEDKNEGYEKSLPAHGDKHFETFVSTMRKNPGQILRYCRNQGKPLFLYEENEPNKCRNCQGKLSFELQVLPSLITYLKLWCGKDLHGIGHLEFGTALIYTCENNCWTNGDIFKYEHVLVQEEKVF